MKIWHKALCLSAILGLIVGCGTQQKRANNQQQYYNEPQTSFKDLIKELEGNPSDISTLNSVVTRTDLGIEVTYYDAWFITSNKKTESEEAEIDKELFDKDSETASAMRKEMNKAPEPLIISKVKELSNGALQAVIFATETIPAFIRDGRTYLKFARHNFQKTSSKISFSDVEMVRGFGIDVYKLPSIMTVNSIEINLDIYAKVIDGKAYVSSAYYITDQGKSEVEEILKSIKYLEE
jgi:hypothetical protein